MDHREPNYPEPLASTMLNSALDAIIGMDSAGNVFEFNRAAEEMFGYRREQVIGEPLAELIIPPSLRERHGRGVAHFRQTGSSKILGNRLEFTAMRKGGAEFPVELTLCFGGIGFA